jgi:hypothetical protein
LGYNGSICLTSVDSVDFRILEPLPFDKKWMSHKFKGAGLRYEIGICLQTGDVVWFNGPFPCGSYNDRLIARDHGLDLSLDAGKMYVADGSYKDGLVHAETPSGRNTNDDWMKSIAHARHEMLNSRFKLFGILRNTFRHDIHKHGIVIGAVASITQVVIEEESPLFQIEYYDGYNFRHNF